MGKAGGAACECRLRAVDLETPRRPALVPRKKGADESARSEHPSRESPGGEKRNGRLARGCLTFHSLFFFFLSPLCPALCVANRFKERSPVSSVVFWGERDLSAPSFRLMIGRTLTNTFILVNNERCPGCQRKAGKITKRRSCIAGEKTLNVVKPSQQSHRRTRHRTANVAWRQKQMKATVFDNH